MKLYCFQCGKHGYDDDYPVENGIAIAENEEQAWRLFFSKYRGFCTSLEDLQNSFYIDKVLSVNKPAAWCGECTN